VAIIKEIVENIKKCDDAIKAISRYPLSLEPIPINPSEAMLAELPSQDMISPSSLEELQEISQELH
jgi:hypothetical protein